nr:PREDICTED: E3 ubiquitin-protein ligase Topors-like [Apteryx mantelli mantelli]
MWHPSLPRHEGGTTLVPQLSSACCRRPCPASDMTCPICLDTWDDLAYVNPCFHQFCFSCVPQWTKSKPECPLCKRAIESVLHLVQADDDFSEYIITPPAEASVTIYPAGRAPDCPATRSHHLMASLPWPLSPQRIPSTTEQDDAEPVPMAPAAGLHTDVWAAIFCHNLACLQPLVPWLQGELRVLFGAQQRLAAAAEGVILENLRCYGLAQHLEPFLQSCTGLFIRNTISFALHLCRGEAFGQLTPGTFCTAEGQEGSPMAAQSPTASPGASPAPTPSLTPSADKLPGTSYAIAQGVPNAPGSPLEPCGGSDGEASQAGLVAGMPSGHGVHVAPAVVREAGQQKELPYVPSGHLCEASWGHWPCCPQLQGSSYSCPSCLPTIPNPKEQREPLEEPREVAAGEQGQVSLAWRSWSLEGTCSRWSYTLYI